MLVREEQRAVVALAFAGEALVSATADGELRVGARVVATRPGLRAVAAAGERVFATAGDELLRWHRGELAAWRFEAGERLQAVAAAGDRVVVGSDREVLRVVDAITGEVVRRLDGGERNPSIACAPDGSIVHVACFQGGSTISVDGVPQVATSFDALSSGAIDGAVYACADRCVRVYRYPSFELRFAFDYDGRRVDAPRDGLSLEATWSPAAFVAGQLVVGSPLGTVFAWDVATGALVKRWAAHRGGVTELVAFGDQIATAGEDAMLRVWRI